MLTNALKLNICIISKISMDDLGILDPSLRETAQKRPINPRGAPDKMG